MEEVSKKGINGKIIRMHGKIFMRKQILLKNYLIFVLFLFLAFLCVLLMGAEESFPAGFAINEQGASAMGKGCAEVATADTPSAIYYNPAGIGFQRGLGIETGITLIFPYSEHKDPETGTVTNSEREIFYPPFAYIAYRLKERFAFGAGFYVPYGLGISWPKNWSGFEEVQSIQLQTYYITPSVAWNPLEWISVGGGVDVIISTVELKKGLNFIDEYGSLHAGGSARNFGWNAGMLLKFLGGRLNFGISYKSSVELEFTGDADFTVPEAFAGLLEDQPVETSLTLPHVFSAGIAGKPVQMLTISAGITVTAWSTFKEFGLYFPEDTYRTPDRRLSQSFPRNWRNVYAIKAGGEILPPKPGWLVLRIGFVYDKSPSPSNTLSPILPDADRIDASAGLGLILPKGFRLDIAYMFVYFFERSSSEEAFAGTYKSHANIISTGVSFKY